MPVSLGKSIQFFLESISFKITPTPPLQFHSCSIKRAPGLLSPIFLPPFFFILCYPFQFPGKFLSSQDYCNTPCWPPASGLSFQLQAADYCQTSIAKTPLSLWAQAAQRRETSPSQGDLGQMNSSFWICFFLSLLCHSCGLSVYKTVYCHKVILF